VRRVTLSLSSTLTSISLRPPWMARGRTSTVYTRCLNVQDLLTRVALRRGAAEFGPPDGGVVVLVDGDGPVAGAAFRRRDPVTAELKRIWTAARYRRRGLARQVLGALEREIAARDYGRIFLTTGPRQPEAVGLYRTAGYTPGFDESLPAEEVGIHAFTKELPRDSATAEPG
jgi:ribosomal protein S18 acetylase RimI-like enzyme